MTIEGWKPADKFEPRLEYGNLWHAAEEALAGRKDPEAAVEEYGISLVKKYPLSQQQVEHWYKLCQAFFPLYVEHWRGGTKTKPIMQEEPFDVLYDLPSGRKVRLRGKWDSVDMEKAKLVIQENKTKSTIDATAIGRQVSFDLQSMFYVIALKQKQSDDFFRRANKGWRHLQVHGVRYNVVRRPAHKSVESALKKFHEDESNGRLGEWFARWDVPISGADVVTFEYQCLIPILENLLDDHEWWEFCYGEKIKHASPTSPFDFSSRRTTFVLHQARHFRFPYGIYNPLSEGGSADLDAMLESGSTAGLTRTTNLFPELQEIV